MDKASAKKLLPYSVGMYIFGWLVALFLFVSFYQISGQEAPNLAVYILGMIDLGIHELSHIVMGFAPLTVMVAAGTGGEFLFAVLLVYAVYKTKAYFGYVFVALWFMMIFIHTGQYMEDAQIQVLQLVSPLGGGEAHHDWAYLFGTAGVLKYCQLIGMITWRIGYVYGAVGLLIGLFFIGTKVFRKQIRF